MLLRFNLFRKRVLIYTAIGNDSYFKIAGKLRGAGVPYSTKSPDTMLSRGRSTLVPNITNRFCQYDFYVKTEDEHRALEAIHRQ